MQQECLVDDGSVSDYVHVRRQHKKGRSNELTHESELEARNLGLVLAVGLSTRARPSSVVNFKPTIISLEPYVAEIMHTATAEWKEGRKEGKKEETP